MLGEDEVTVVGNSIGGWTAAELFLPHNPRVRDSCWSTPSTSSSPHPPVTDISGLTPYALSRLSFHDPEPFRIDPPQ
jgi:hypothetical protein